MTEIALGRLLAASLHQALMDELPQRLEFYEHWLHSEGLRDGSIGLAPMSAVVGFLRAEGDGYGRVVARAGTLAADWWIESLPGTRRRVIGWLPRPLRIRAALRVAAEIAESVNSESRVSRRVRGGVATMGVTSSIFCSVRSSQPLPLCGFYVALVIQVLRHFGFEAVGRTAQCKAMEGTSCVMSIDFSVTGLASPPAIAA
jgi:hypothetical protein